MLFKNRIAEILSAQNLKQADLCRMTGISTALMSIYVTGKASPSLDKAEIIANALGCTLDYLVGREPTPIFLSKIQTELLNGFDMLDTEGQNLIMGMLSALRVSHAKQEKYSEVVQRNNEGTNFIVTGSNNYSIVTP